MLEEFNLEILVTLDDELIEPFIKALSPELKETGKVKASLSKEKNLLIIKLSSSDLSKLKAVSSSLARCIFSAKETLDKVREES
ncbi:MAG: hypothetical protein QXX95_01535 [Nitrososphaerales archaeon]